MPAAGARSVTVTGTGVAGGDVGDGGAGTGPTPGAGGTGGTGAGARVGSETGPVGQFACSTSELAPWRPTMVIADPVLSVASPMSSSIPPGSADFTVAHVVPSKCTTSVWVPC